MPRNHKRAKVSPTGPDAATKARHGLTRGISDGNRQRSCLPESWASAFEYHGNVDLSEGESTVRSEEWWLGGVERGGRWMAPGDAVQRKIR